jgi:DNA-binding XRE family transcriptional regulator
VGKVSRYRRHHKADKGESMAEKPELKLREKCLRPCPHCNGSGSITDDVMFGNLMRANRYLANVSLRELARKIGLSHGYINDLERGRRKWRDELITSYTDGIHALAKL